MSAPAGGPVDSLQSMRSDEMRILIVALLNRLGGEVSFTGKEIDDAAYNRPQVVQIKFTDTPRIAHVRLENAEKPAPPE